MNRRKLIIVICIFLAVTAALGAVYLFIIRPNEQEREPEYDALKHFYTEEPDWETNILEDEDYLSLNRTLYYSNGTETYKYDPGDESIPDSASVFPGYLDAIIMGEREKVNSYYTDDFLDYIAKQSDKEESKRHPYYRCVTEDFTMQRLYDMRITFVGRPIDEETGEQYDYYIMSYRISLNNGTFLNILGENLGGHDVSLDQHIQVVNRDGRYLITSVGFTVPEELD